MKKEEKKILWLDDSKDIGKKPLPIDNPEARKVYEKLMEKYIREVQGPVMHDRYAGLEWIPHFFSIFR